MHKMISKKSKNKKALSTVVATVIIILLTMAAITIVWVFVKNIVNQNKDKVESCFEVESSEKVNLNPLYTCYTNKSEVGGDAGFEEVQFSINIADVEIDSLVVAIEFGGESRSIILNNTPVQKSNMKMYNSANNWGVDLIALPDKNAGKTYVVNFDGTTATKVDLIRIAPVINGEQCGVTDRISNVVNCNLLIV